MYMRFILLVVSSILLWFDLTKTNIATKKTLLYNAIDFSMRKPKAFNVKQGLSHSKNEEKIMEKKMNKR